MRRFCPKTKSVVVSDALLFVNGHQRLILDVSNAYFLVLDYIRLPLKDVKYKGPGLRKHFLFCLSR